MNDDPQHDCTPTYTLGGRPRRKSYASQKTVPGVPGARDPCSLLILYTIHTPQKRDFTAFAIQKTKAFGVQNTSMDPRADLPTAQSMAWQSRRRATGNEQQTLVAGTHTAPASGEMIYWTFRHSPFRHSPLAIHGRESTSHAIIESICQQQVQSERLDRKRHQRDRYDLHDAATGERYAEDAQIPARLTVQVRRRPARTYDPIVLRTIFIRADGSWRELAQGEAETVPSHSSELQCAPAHTITAMITAGKGTVQASLGMTSTATPPNKKLRTHESETQYKFKYRQNHHYNESLRCPLTGDKFDEPVVTLCCGSTFSKVALQKYTCCPNCSRAVTRTIPNKAIAMCVSAMHDLQHSETESQSFSQGSRQ